MLRGLCSGEALFIPAFLWVCYDLSCNRVCCHASAPEKASHRFRLCLVGLRTSLVFLDLAINSFLSRTILVSNIPFRSVSFPSVSAVSTFVLASISTSMSSLQYRRDTLHSVPSSLPSSFQYFRRQFSTFITSPSSMAPNSTRR